MYSYLNTYRCTIEIGQTEFQLYYNAAWYKKQQFLLINSVKSETQNNNLTHYLTMLWNSTEIALEYILKLSLAQYLRQLRYVFIKQSLSQTMFFVVSIVTLLPLLSFSLNSQLNKLKVSTKIYPTLISRKFQDYLKLLGKFIRSLPYCLNLTYTKLLQGKYNKTSVIGQCSRDSISWDDALEIATGSITIKSK